MNTKNSSADHPVTKVTFSGNQAKYSVNKIVNTINISGLDEAANSFTNISSVKFNTDLTISIYHYGNLDGNVIEELKRIRHILRQNSKLIAFGFDYTNNVPLLIIIDCAAVRIVPYKIRIKHNKHSDVLEEISQTFPLELEWNNYQRQSDYHYPALINVIEPDHEGFEFSESSNK